MTSSRAHRGVAIGSAHFRSRLGRTLVLALPLVLGFAVAVQACNVPVFRFALERWRPDPYRATLFHRGPLTEADRALVGALNEREVKGSINLTLRELDVAEPHVAELEEADRELFSSLGDPKLPLLVVQYPAHLRITEPVWSGPLNTESVALLTDSSVRNTLVRRLADGQTAVWLLLESGQTAKDDAAAQLLQQQLKKLEQELKLPELTDSSEDKLAAALPLKVAFSVMRVSRAEAEKPLVQMLLRSEPDLAERSDPMVFPVFGRGRALLPLIGAGVTAENIRDSAAFLVGACSCEVKEQNPGFDLLLTANWDALLTQDGAPLLASVTRKALPRGEPELVPIPRGSPKVSATVPAPTSSAVTSAPPATADLQGQMSPPDGETLPVPTSPCNNWLVVCLVVGGVLLVLVVRLCR